MTSVKTRTIRPPTSPGGLALARTMLGRAVGFGDCDALALDALAQVGQLRTLGRGEYAFRRGDPPVSAWLLVDGLIECSITRRDGQRHLLGLLLPGDFFGLMGVVDDGPCEQDVSARAASVALVLPLARLRELRREHPSLVNACEKQFVLRARLLQKRGEALDPGVALDARAASMLQLLSQIYGTTGPEGIEFPMKLTQTDMADWLGLSRQRMNFVLKQLEAEGLIRLHYSSLVITDPVGLSARADN